MGKSLLQFSQKREFKSAGGSQIFHLNAVALFVLDFIAETVLKELWIT